MTEALTLAQRLRHEAGEIDAFGFNDGTTDLIRKAADRIETDASTIASLRDANKALTAEIEIEKEAHRLTRVAEFAKISYRDKRFAEMDATVARLSAELAEARKERDRYKNGLQTLATTFYKEDQHQDYAKHVLASKEASHATE